MRGDERFFCNSPIRHLPLELAPPPPPEEKPDFINDNPRSRSKGMDFREAMRNDAAKQAQRREAAKAATLQVLPAKPKPPSLTDAQCSEVKLRLAAGDFITDIARDYKVTRDCIYLIKEKGIASSARRSPRKADPSCPHGHTTKHGKDAYGKMRRKCHDCGKVWRVE
jgi:hypothetical protein